MIMGPSEMSYLMMMIMSGFSSGSGFVGMMGVPPGPRDTKLVQTASADSLIYVEWSERSGGKEGAKGIDGLAADPEVRQFLDDVYKAITTGIEKETENADPAERTLGKHIPPLVRILLNRPGCLSASLDLKSLKEAGAAGPAPGGGPNWLALALAGKAVFVVNGGEQADTIAKHINELVQLLPAEMRKKDLQRQPIPLPDAPPGISMTLHRHGNYFIVGYGKGTIDQAIAGLDGKSKGLAAKTAFTDSVKRVAFERPANLTWLNASSIKALVTVLMGAEIGKSIEMLGLDSLDTIVSATGLVDGNIRSRSYVGTGGKTEGVLALFSGRAMKPADFAHVPADSDLVLGFSLNAKGVLSAVRKIITAADPKGDLKRDFEKFIEQFETELGLKLEEDLIAAFGDALVLHDSKSAGGLLVTSLVGSLEVRDHQKAADVFTKIMDVVEASLPGEIRGGFRRRGVFLKQKRFLGQAIYYINIVGDDDVPFAPSFCLTKSHLLVAPHPQALKAHLRFLKDKGKNFGARLGKEIALPQGDLIGVSFVESKQLLRMIYAFVPYFGQVIMSEIQRGGAEIDIFSVPSARAILPYLGDSFATTVRTEQGIFSEAQSGAPGSGSLVAGFMMPFVVLFGARARAMEKRAVPLKKLNALPPRNGKSPTAALLRALPGLLKRAARRNHNTPPVSARRPRKAHELRPVGLRPPNAKRTAA